jgi:hypothetical protein
MTKDMQAKHTEGPWTTDLVISSQAGRVAIEPDIAIVYVQPSRYDGSESKRRLANARLIAAAPDLLAALENIIGLVDKMDAWNDTRDEIQHAARAAIAKARGGGK